MELWIGTLLLLLISREPCVCQLGRRRGLVRPQRPYLTHFASVMFYFNYKCMSVLCVCAYNMYVPSMYSVPMAARREQHILLELELKMAVSCHMGSGTLTQVLWKISQYS